MFSTVYLVSKFQFRQPIYREIIEIYPIASCLYIYMEDWNFSRKSQYTRFASALYSVRSQVQNRLQWARY